MTTPTPGQPLSEAGVSLLPCPFCGGEAWLNDYEAKYSDLPPKSRAPQCRSCGASLGYLTTPAKAIAAWNRRPHAPVSRPGDGVEANRECRACGAFKPDRDAACGFCGAALTPPAEPASRPAGEGEREAVARIVDPSAFLFAPDELPKGSRAQYDAFDKADRIIALLSPAAPDGGGWHCPHCDRMLVMGCGCNFTAAIPASEGGRG